MTRFFIAGVAALFLATGAAKAQTHNADFPDQMNAINACYVAYIVHTSPPRAPMDNKAAAVADGDDCAQPVAAARLGPAAASAVANQMARLEG